MGFKASLGACARPPLMFEPVPPPKRSSPAEIDAHLDELADIIGHLPHVGSVNVPQIVGGSYETVDALDYAISVQRTTGVETLVNKIVALTPPDELPAWVEHAREQGIRHLILVGGESSRIDYPGPSVTQANRIAAPLVDDGTIGNICIPFRRRRGSDEPDRMVQKTQAGADHFTSQIVLEPLTTRRLLRDYDRACRLAGVRPATVFIGLAPVTDARDIKLLKHLGVEVPAHVERDILWDEKDVGLRSLELNLGILRQVLEAARNENIQVPIGLNVEQVSLKNWDASVELAQEAAFLLEEHTWLAEDPSPRVTTPPPVSS
ncbi:MAG: hypothetical protein KY455_03135 [Euryarchaeota archaeon]|nr:hypothetical protein [Euryarchaeota archaeon]